jgi:hypothetical protein
MKLSNLFHDVYFSKAALCIHSVSGLSFIYLAVIYGNIPGQFTHSHGEDRVRLQEPKRRGELCF